MIEVFTFVLFIAMCISIWVGFELGKSYSSIELKNQEEDAERYGESIDRYTKQ